MVIVHCSFKSLDQPIAKEDSDLTDQGEEMQFLKGTPGGCFARGIILQFRLPFICLPLIVLS